MDYKETHLIEKNRIHLARNYLVHEFRKIFCKLSYDDTNEAIKRLAPTKNSDDVAIRDFWNLFCAISSGSRLKDLYNIVTDKSIEWKNEKKSIKKFIPQDKHGWIQKLTDSDPDPDNFFQLATSYLQSNSDNLKKALKQSEEERGNRADGDENDPIIAIEINNTFEVRDGCSRWKVKMEKWLMEQPDSQPPTLNAWIGYPTNGESNVWIQTGSIIFMKEQFFNNCKIIDVDIEKFLQSISELAVMEYNKRVKE